MTLSDLVSEKGTIPASQIELFRVDYIPLSRISDFYGRLVAWPDPLYPLSSDNTVHLTAGENQPLWIRIKVPGNASAGLYTGTLTIGTNQIPYTLEVWNFFLPEYAHLNTSVGFDWDTVLAAYGASDPTTPSNCAAQLESVVLDSLASYHLTPNPNLDGVTISYSDRL